MKKEALVDPVVELLYDVRHNTNEEQILNYAKKFANDEVIGLKLLSNLKLTEEAKAVFARSSNTEIRRKLAGMAENIESTKTQLRLAHDKDKVVKEELARTTTKEEIKEILFRTNPEWNGNYKIRGTCLRRMRNQNIIERFILTSHIDILAKYADYILQNRHMSRYNLNIFVILCTELSAKQKEMARNHPQFDKYIKLT